MKIRKFGSKVRADAGIILGKRVTKVFNTRRDAENWLRIQDRTRNDLKLGIRRIIGNREQIAALAFEKLDTAGLPEETLLDAVRRFITFSNPGKPSALFDALSAFERDLQFGNRSPVYIDTILRVLQRFRNSFPDKKLHEITGDDCQQWLIDNCEKAQNRANRRRELKVFFSWAKKQNMIAENPIDRIPKVSVDRGRPEILTLAQVRAGLENLSGQDRALFAVMVFAGLRPSEAEALEWRDVHLDRKFLQNVHGFRADQRNVKLSDNLITWLRPLASTGKVFNGHGRRWRDRVQRAMAKGGAELPQWPQDVLRHTFASYHLEAHKNAAETAYEMGHAGNPRMIYTHYRDLVTPEDAKAFWQIYPKGN